MSLLAQSADEPASTAAQCDCANLPKYASIFEANLIWMVGGWTGTTGRAMTDFGQNAGLRKPDSLTKIFLNQNGKGSHSGPHLTYAKCKWRSEWLRHPMLSHHRRVLVGGSECDCEQSKPSLCAFSIATPEPADSTISAPLRGRSRCCPNAPVR